MMWLVLLLVVCALGGVLLVATLHFVRVAMGRAALRRWAEAEGIALHEAKTDDWGYARFAPGAASSRPCFRIRVTTAEGLVRAGHALAGPAGILFSGGVPVDVRWDTPVPSSGAAAAR